MIFCPPPSHIQRLRFCSNVPSAVYARWQFLHHVSYSEERREESSLKTRFERKKEGKKKKKKKKKKKGGGKGKGGKDDEWITFDAAPIQKRPVAPPGAEHLKTERRVEVTTHDHHLCSLLQYDSHIRHWFPF